MRFAHTATILSVALVVTAQAAYAFGQPTQDESKRTDESGDIVVTGRRASPDKTIAETRAISNTHNGQLARFETPICPAVVGLPQAHARVVEWRIRNVADRAKVRVDKLGCKPNVTIVVADDGAAFVNLLHRKRPTLFNTMALHDVTKLLKSQGPCWAWQSISPKRRDGGSVEMISQIQLGSGPPQPVAKGAYIASNVQLSRLSMPVRQDTDLAFVVLDLKNIKGLTLQQVADYSAMVGLAAIRTAKTDILEKPSILTMFQDAASGRAIQPEATAFDLAYLAALYSGSSGFSSDQKSMAIASQIKRSTKKP